MSILRDLQEHLRDDFDRELSACEEYNEAEERLHRFIESELPPDKLGEIESLITDINNAMFHAAVEIGMKYGAKLMAELLK